MAALPNDVQSLCSAVLAGHTPSSQEPPALSRLLLFVARDFASSCHYSVRNGCRTMTKHFNLWMTALLFVLTACQPVKRTEVHDAIRAMDTAKVKHLLTVSPELVMATDSLGDTPLHVAVQMGSAELVEWLLAHKAGVNAKASAGWTALHWVAYWNRRDIAELLLRHQADVNARNSIGFTPLHWAAYRGSQEVVKLLLAHNADANATDYYHRTPLHHAAYWNRKAAAEALLAHNADINAKTYADTWADGRFFTPLTPLDLALDHGETTTAELLRRRGGVQAPK
jgi:ankyrin repeat protein